MAVGSLIAAAVNVVGPTEPRSGWPLALAIIAFFVALAVARRLWAAERLDASADDGGGDSPSA